MFCDGQCIKGKKTCGLLYSVFMENVMTKQVEEVKKCAFLHMADSFARLEGGNVRLQAAVESSRNEQANADHKSSSIMATGFVGMLHAMNENPEKFEKALKLLNAVAINEDKLLLASQRKQNESG